MRPLNTANAGPVLGVQPAHPTCSQATPSADLQTVLLTSVPGTWRPPIVHMLPLQEKVAGRSLCTHGASSAAQLQDTPSPEDHTSRGFGTSQLNQPPRMTMRPSCTSSPWESRGCHSAWRFTHSQQAVLVEAALAAVAAVASWASVGAVVGCGCCCFGSRCWSTAPKRLDEADAMSASASGPPARLSGGGVAGVGVCVGLSSRRERGEGWGLLSVAAKSSRRNRHSRYAPGCISQSCS